MKNLIFKLLLIACVYLFSIKPTHAQTVVKLNANGNYEAVKTERKQSEAKPTGKTFTDQRGKVYPVYVSAKGKLFCIKTSQKTGQTYNYYLQTEAKN